jgi:hypothetical protein
MMPILVLHALLTQSWKLGKYIAVSHIEKWNQVCRPGPPHSWGSQELCIQRGTSWDEVYYSVQSLHQNLQPQRKMRSPCAKSGPFELHPYFLCRYTRQQRFALAANLFQYTAVDQFKMTILTFPLTSRIRQFFAEDWMLLARRESTSLAQANL